MSHSMILFLNELEKNSKYHVLSMKLDAQTFAFENDLKKFFLIFYEPFY